MDFGVEDYDIIFLLHVASDITNIIIILLQ